MSGKESEETVFQEFLEWKRARSMELHKEPNLSQSSSSNSSSSVQDIDLEELEQKGTEEKNGS